MSTGRASVSEAARYVGGDPSEDGGEKDEGEVSGDIFWFLDLWCGSGTQLSRRDRGGVLFGTGHVDGGGELGARAPRTLRVIVRAPVARLKRGPACAFPTLASPFSRPPRPPRPHAHNTQRNMSFKAVVLGAAGAVVFSLFLQLTQVLSGGIGQPLSLLLKTNPLVKEVSVHRERRARVTQLCS